MKALSVDYLILSETKIDESFPASQFNVMKFKAMKSELGVIEINTVGV